MQYDISESVRVRAFKPIAYPFVSSSTRYYIFHVVRSVKTFKLYLFFPTKIYVFSELRNFTLKN